MFTAEKASLSYSTVCSQKISLEQKHKTTSKSYLSGRKVRAILTTATVASVGIASFLVGLYIMKDSNPDRKGCPDFPQHGNDDCYSPLQWSTGFLTAISGMAWIGLSGYVGGREALKVSEASKLNEPQGVSDVRDFLMKASNPRLFADKYDLVVLVNSGIFPQKKEQEFFELLYWYDSHVEMKAKIEQSKHEKAELEEEALQLDIDWKNFRTETAQKMPNPIPA